MYRVGLSIAALKKEFQSAPEGLAIIDKYKEMSGGTEAMMRCDNENRGKKAHLS